MTIIERQAIIIQACLVPVARQKWCTTQGLVHLCCSGDRTARILKPSESRGKPVQSTIKVPVLLGAIAHLLCFGASFATSSSAHASQPLGPLATLDAGLSGALPCERLVEEDFKNTFEAPLSVLSAKLVPAKDGTAEYCAVTGVIQP